MKKLIYLLFCFLFVQHRIFNNNITLLQILIVTTISIVIIIKNNKLKIDIKSMLRFISINIILISPIVILGFNNVESNYLQQTRDWIFVIIFCLLIKVILNNFKGIKEIFLNAVYTMAILNSILSILQYLTGKFYIVYMSSSIELKNNILGETILNPVVGFFNHNNPNAYMMLICLVLVLYFNKRFKMLIVYLLSIVIILTQVKMAMILLFEVYIILIINKILKEKSNFRFITIAFILLNIIAYITMFNYDVEILGTLRDRVNLFKVSIDMIIDNPKILLIGNGNEMFYMYSEQYSRFGYSLVHNSFSDIIITQGLFGIIIIFIIIKSAFNSLFNKRKIMEKTFLNVIWLIIITAMLMEPIITSENFKCILAILVIFEKNRGMIGEYDEEN